MKAKSYFSLRSLHTRAMMAAFFYLFASIITPAANAQSTRGNEYNKPDQLLDALHDNAAAANWDDYFNLFGPNSIFIGTDTSEVWTVPAFKRFALETKGWKYTVKSRQMQTGNTGDVIWFHELLWNKSYGETRGTGTLIKTDKGWKIAQYSLTIPVPNAIAKKVVTVIKDHQKSQ